MSRRTVLALVAALVVSGCGGSGTPADTGPSARSLAARLVQAEDLGPGWSVLKPPEDFGDVGVVTKANQNLVPGFDLCERAGTTARGAAKRLTWEAFTQHNFTTGADTHLVFVQEFLRSDEAAKVRDTFDRLAAGRRACNGQTETYPDGESGTWAELQVPAIGQDRIGAREIVAEPGGGDAASWDIRSVLARQGTVLLAVTVVEIVVPGQAKVLDDAAVDRLLTTIADGAF